MFTGDRSGEFLYAGLYRAGLASQPQSLSRDDGMRLEGCFITAPVRCAPPGNLPTPSEVRACRPSSARELRALEAEASSSSLGAIAWAAILEHLGWPAPRPKFAHGAVLDDRIVGCYHVSQQNTQTGRLTPAMFDAALRSALTLVRRE